MRRLKRRKLKFSFLVFVDVSGVGLFEGDRKGAPLLYTNVEQNG